MMSHWDTQRCDRDNRGLGETRALSGLRAELTPGGGTAAERRAGGGLD